MGFKAWLEDNSLDTVSADIDIEKKPLHLTNPLRMAPSSWRGRKVERDFGVKRRPKPAAKTLVVNDRQSSPPDDNDMPST